MAQMPHPDTGEMFELTNDNTTIYLFQQSDECDHVLVDLGDGRQMAIYEPEVIGQMQQLDFPLYYRIDAPMWAIDRRMGYEAQEDDWDKLLESTD